MNLVQYEDGRKSPICHGWTYSALSSASDMVAEWTKDGPEPVPRSQIRRGTPIFFCPEISPSAALQITNFDARVLIPCKSRLASRLLRDCSRRRLIILTYSHFPVIVISPRRNITNNGSAYVAKYQPWWWEMTHGVTGQMQTKYNIIIISRRSRIFLGVTAATS